MSPPVRMVWYLSLHQAARLPHGFDKENNMLRSGLFATAICAMACAPAVAQDAVFSTRSLTPEAALQAARSAMDSCRKQGYQVAVAVVDRSGLTQVLLRDRFAGAHTVEVATNKAWTSASFRISSMALGGGDASRQAHERHSQPAPCHGHWWRAGDHKCDVALHSGSCC